MTRSRSLIWSSVPSSECLGQDVAPKLQVILRVPSYNNLHPILREVKPGKVSRGENNICWLQNKGILSSISSQADTRPQYQDLGSIGIAIAASNTLRGEGGGWRDSREEAESLEAICDFSAGYNAVVDCVNSATYSPDHSIAQVKIGPMVGSSKLYDLGKSMIPTFVLIC